MRRPVAVSQRPLVELAREQARQRLGEVDRARALHQRQVLAAKGDQRLCESIVGQHAGHRLHDRLDFFAQVFVRHAEHRGVGHLRMRDEQVLALLWVDVDATRDDHERGAIGQVEKAVVVEVADVAHRAHRAVCGSAGLGALRVLEILERRGGLEPELARRALGRRLHRFVEHVQLAQHGLADAAAVRRSGCWAKWLPAYTT